jgi:DNA-directed RNA polymerase specialized sigma24 family protein
MTMTDTRGFTRELKPEEAEAIERLRDLTEAANEKRNEASQIASSRRDVIVELREMGWSYRRIGETIGVSGQRIDSMLRLGAKGEAEAAK